ncbi:aminopeptidase P family protein [Facilibium subflavum]|uniref:aminopeptidase P family protein n=1 Tax=Facilibium subflavum TaxID=2219058 RepID=UPI000E65D011|nr:aminopeptidase P family protein [Facilibium subflavum]
MTLIADRIKQLRQRMQQHQYDFYLVPSSDAHNSEYVPNHWQRRAWISGFDGSAGEALIGLNSAYLWTDGRYFLQAENQLDSSIYTLQKQSGFTLELEQWLKENAKGKTLGIDPTTIPIKRAQDIHTIMEEIHGHCVFEPTNLVDLSKKDLNDFTSKTTTTITIQPQKYTGLQAQEKCAQIRQKMAKENIDTLVLTVLDEIAWLLNIRGNDIPFNPLVIGYVLLTQDKCTFFVNPDKLDNTIKDYFLSQKIITKPYNHFQEALKQCQGKVWIDDKTANYWILQQLPKEAQTYFAPSPVILPKACKNITELDGAKLAHKKDAVAMISFIHWLYNNWQNGLDEIKAQEKLEQFRQKQKHFKGPSFDTISGFGSNGAVIHYRATTKTNKKIDDRSLYLLDSGGQYLEGTTDITRTFHLGTPTTEQKYLYTLVLKGHLAIQNAHFPEGTRGEQLDTLARYALWQNHANYAHGTGHGVGSFLCVHEGPQRISPAFSNQALQPGMILSNEPGVYLDGQFGIRIENLCFVKPAKEQNYQQFGQFYCFEDLTLVPYACNLIELQLLTNTEITQINAYHQRVYKELSSMIVDEAVKHWLSIQTRPL